MAEISKLSGVAIADVAKVDAVTKANIANINDLTIPADGFLLDTYTGAIAAHSFRRLNSLYTGACCRIRRSNDNAEQDIGFDSNGYVDKSAIQSFVPSNQDGFITKWYGQESSGGTGSGNDAVQTITSAQPRIIENNTFNEQGGFIVITRSQNVSRLAFDLDTTLTNSSMDMFCAFYAPTATTMMLSSDPNDTLLIQQNGDTGNHTVRMGTPSYYFNGSQFTGTTRGDLYTELAGQRNCGAIMDVDVNDAVRTRYGWYGSPSFINIPFYRMHEMVIFSNQSSNRVAITTEQNNYYSIFT